jgi:hypothetical protein
LLRVEIEEIAQSRPGMSGREVDDRDERKGEVGGEQQRNQQGNSADAVEHLTRVTRVCRIRSGFVTAFYALELRWLSTR